MDGYTTVMVPLCHQESVIDGLGASDPGPNLFMFSPPPQNGEHNGSSQAHWSIVRIDCFSQPIKLSGLH